MDFLPHPASRLACALPGALVSAVAFGLVTDADAGVAARYGWLTVLAVGVTAAVRGYRMAVLVTDRGVTIRGLLRSRTIPTNRIVAVCATGRTGRWPAVHWVTGSGRARRSPIVMFADTGRFATIDRYNRGVRAALRPDHMSPSVTASPTIPCMTEVRDGRPDRPPRG